MALHLGLSDGAPGVIVRVAGGPRPSLSWVLGEPPMQLQPSQCRQREAWNFPEARFASGSFATGDRRIENRNSKLEAPSRDLWT